MPVHQPSLLSTLSTLREEHLDMDELDGSLRRVVEATCSVFGVAGAGLMLVDENGQLRYVAATDGRSAALEAAQAETGEGPCVDSLLRDVVVQTDELGTDARWPTLAGQLDGLGMVGLLGVPIHVERTSVGSLNVYTDRPCPWEQTDVEGLRAFAVVLEELLQHSLRARERHTLAEQLDRALTNRVLVERAVGVVMAERRVDPVAAFNVLRSQARAERRKVASVAEEVLASVQGSRSFEAVSGDSAGTGGHR
jgi:GAF domain-containing protein